MINPNTLNDVAAEYEARLAAVKAERDAILVSLAQAADDLIGFASDVSNDERRAYWLREMASAHVSTCIDAVDSAMAVVDPAALEARRAATKEHFAEAWRKLAEERSEDLSSRRMAEVVAERDAARALVRELAEALDRASLGGMTRPEAFALVERARGGVKT